MEPPTARRKRAPSSREVKGGGGTGQTDRDEGPGDRRRLRRRHSGPIEEARKFMRLRYFLMAALFLLPVARRASAQWAGAPPTGFGSLNVSTTGVTAGQGETAGVR